jgi:uncharacterized protein YhaN
MRFEELHLERFGHFDGLRLDLSGEDVLLHLVYGPNEAGKSTALTAICDLLFGIPERTSFNFRHEYGRLRIGGTLTNTAGQRLSFKRRKARVNTLLRPDESGELPENSLAPYLGGATREFFERMFGLNHERLRAGGKAMLDTGGEVARSLFEAGSGTMGMASEMKAIADSAEEIGSPARKSASKPYWRAHDRYEKAVDRMRAEALKADAWNSAVAALEDASALRKELDETLAEGRRKRSALERIRRVAPILRRVDDLAFQLEAVADVPVLPDGFEEAWRLAVQGEQAARENVKAHSENLKRVQGELEALGDPGPWVSMTKRVEKLVTGLGDYRSKRTDLPHRVRDLENGGRQMMDLLRQLGPAVNLDFVAEQRPSEPAAARVRSLMSKWNRLDTALASAQQEFEKADRALDQVQNEARVAGDASDPAEAGVAVEAARALGDTTNRIARAQLELRTAEESLSDAVNALGPCAVTADDLAKTVLPSAEIVVRFEQQFDRTAAEILSTEEEIAALQADLRRINGDLETLRAGGDVPTPEVLGMARERRDDGWRLIRRRYVEGVSVPEEQLSDLAPDGDVAGAFESSVLAADQLADRREREAARVERFATLSGQEAKAREDIRAAERRIQQLNDRVHDAELRWAATWTKTGIVPGTPTEMRGWLARKDEVLVRHQAARKAMQAAVGAELEDNQVRSHLLRAAMALGLTEVKDLSTAALRDRVKAAFDSAENRWDQCVELRRVVAESKRQHEERRRDLEKVSALLTKWQARWADEMPALGLAKDATPAEADAALSIWQKVGVLEADQTQTRRRRDQLDDAIRAYEDEARALIEDLGAAAADLDEEQDVAALVSIIQRRLSEALQLAARVDDARRNVRQSSAALDDAEGAGRKAAVELRALRKLHGLPEDADIVRLAQQSVGRRALESKLEYEREGLTAQGDGRDESSLRDEAAGIDTDTAAAEVGRLEGEIAHLQDALQVAAQTVTVAEANIRALKDREGIGEAAQEANDAAAEMIACTERWLRFRAATIILNRAVERYRAQNQHPLVRRASEIFGAVAGTGDNPIVRLSVDYTDEDKPTLVGFRRDESMCPVSGMSDGTLDQLYLALRIAAIERYAEGAEAMPFVADDLFITSDEERTVPGIRALAELGRHTQVLLFTHHRYVADAAVQALAPGQLRVHSLRDEPRERIALVS